MFRQLIRVHFTKTFVSLIGFNLRPQFLHALELHAFVFSIGIDDFISLRTGLMTSTRCNGGTAA